MAAAAEAPKTKEKKVHQLVDELERSQLRSDIPAFAPGDTLRVEVKVRESADRSRVQAFQGICIRRRGEGCRETFTVRKISFGVGVERTFLVHSPQIEKIKVVREGHVRRAKLYYLRGLIGKKATKVKAKKREVLGEASRRPSDKKASTE